MQTTEPQVSAMNSMILRIALSVSLLSSSALAQISDFCFGDGTGTACPCANSSAFGADEGCLNSFGSGGKLRATGIASLSDDGDGTPSLRLDGTQMTNGSYGYFQGTSQQSGGSGVAFGDGLRCAGGALIRLHWPLRFNVAGASHFPDATMFDPAISVKGLVTTPGTRTYQIFYRDAAIGFCTTNTFNTTNAVSVTWGA